MSRIDEFNIGHKNFVYVDLSEISTSDELKRTTKAIEPIIARYPKKSLYSITNINDFEFDTETKSILSSYVAHVEPFIKYWTVIGCDGIKKIMSSTTSIPLNELCKIIDRLKMHITYTRDSAIAWLQRMN